MDFSLSRLFNLIRKDFIIHKKYLLLSIISMFAVCALMIFFTSDGAPKNSNQVPPDAGEIVYAVLLILCGSIITASIFREFRNGPERLKFLGLPASNFEKVLSKWLYTLPLFFILTVIIYLVGYPLFTNLIGAMVELEFVPLQELNLRFFGYITLTYFIIHSGIFLFSIFYNRFPIPKIIVTGFVLLFAGAFVLGIFFRVVFYDHFEGFMRGSDLMFSRELSSEFKDWATIFFNKLPLRFAMIGVPFIWLISYFKMKEKEL